MERNRVDKHRLVSSRAILSEESLNYGNVQLGKVREVHSVSGKMKNNNEAEEKWQVGEEPGVGQMLLARQDILPWELVLEDRALLQAPMDLPVCLRCLGSLETSKLCPNCKWPLCGTDCVEDDQDWHKIECAVLAKSGVRPGDGEGGELYSMLGLLRMILILRHDEESRIKYMMDHWEVFSKDEVLVEGTAKMTDFMQKHLGLSWVSVEDVQHCFGVLKTNSMKIKDGRGQVVFPIASLLSHSCSPNLEVPLSLPSHCTTVTQFFRSWESWEMSFL